MAEHHLFKHINGSLYGIVCLNNLEDENNFSREKKLKLKKINIYLFRLRWMLNSMAEASSRWKQVSTQKSHSDKLNNITELLFVSLSFVLFSLKYFSGFSTHSWQMANFEILDDFWD